MKKLLTNFIIYKLIFVIFLTYGIFEILYSLRQILANIFSSTTVPIVGTFNNPAPFAIILSIVAPLSWYYIINKLWKFKVNDIIDNIISILSILFFISMPIALYMSQSRTGWLATIISCSIITLLKLFEYPNWRHYCSIFLSFIIVALCLLSVPAYKIKQNSADGRLLIWKISTSIIKEHPVFGISEGNFSGNYGYAQAKYFESGKGTDKEKMLAGSPKYAYNEYIQIAVQLGIAGLLIFTTILSYCFYNLSKSTISESNAIIGMLTSLLIVMGFSYPLRIFETCIISCFIIQ